MGIFSCNYGNCERRPHIEVYYEDEEKKSCWCFLCFWHYIWVRFIKREKGNGYADVDTNREVLEHILEEIWDMQHDLWKIKEKLKIKEEKVTYETEKPEEKGFA